MKTRKLTFLHIGIYLIVFFTFWSVRELILRQELFNFFTPMGSELIGETIKLLTWTLPAVFLIHYFRNDMTIGLKEMFTNKLNWSRDGIFVMVFFILFIARFIYARIVYGSFGLNPNMEPIRLIGAVLFVGITEELVFRGFLLNAFMKKMDVKFAVALDAILFTLIHYPIWIYMGFGALDIARSSFSVLIISAGLAYSFIKTRNILVPIALHMAWNLSIRLFIR